MSFTMQALLIAIACAWLRMPGGWPSNWQTSLAQFLGSWLIGWICGDMTTGLIVGGMIQTINLVPVYVGGVITMDLWFSCCIVIPVIVHTGMDIEAAVALAAPLSVLGNTVLNTMKQVLILDMWAAPYVKKLAAEGNDRQIRLVNILYAPALNVIYGTVFSFICIQLGVAGAEKVVNMIPEAILYGFNAVAGLLPAIGMMLFIALLGKRSDLPFYFLGFYLVEFAGLDMIKSVIVALILASIVLILHMETNKKIEQSSNSFGGDF